MKQDVSGAPNDLTGLDRDKNDTVSNAEFIAGLSKGGAATNRAQ